MTTEAKYSELKAAVENLLEVIEDANTVDPGEPFISMGYVSLIQSHFYSELFDDYSDELAVERLRRLLK
jgi:hypothetical protein